MIWQALFERADFRKSCCFDREPLWGDSSVISLLGRRLLGEKYGVDVGEDTSRRDGDAAEQLVQLLVVLDGEGDVTGHDASLLVIAGGVTGKLQNLGTEVLEDGGKVDGGAGAHAGGVLSLAEVTADTAYGELKSGLGRRGGALLLAAASFSFSRHGW